MRNTPILAVVCLLVCTLAASSANARESYATQTGKQCSYCHVNGDPDQGLTSAGQYYDLQGTLPPPPTVTSITPSSSPQAGAVSITNLAGTTFLTGATVKLKRTGFPDIAASSVIVVSASKITCAFNLTGRKTGLWDVSITNSDGLSGLLSSGFGINVPSSLPLVGASTRWLRDGVMATASTKWRYRVWGKVQPIDWLTFWLDDGSGAPVKVFAPGYSGIVNGSYVVVTGGADVSTSPATMISSSAQITRIL